MLPGPSDPRSDCPRCSRLAAFRAENRQLEPDWFNAPVPSFGPADAELLIVGLAPGLRGANRTGRPFTGDYAGDLLYGMLEKFGFAQGIYAARPDDGLMLVNCRITNAVRCVPPQNKPIGSEIRSCRAFLTATFAEMQTLRVVLTLGRIAHESVLAALGAKSRSFPFSHGAQHQISDLSVINSFHCSRYNTNTGKLTTEMFEDVFLAIRKTLASRSQVDRGQ